MVKKAFQVTLADIARKLGVTKVTISKALRGHPDISAQTVAKVKKLAREMGYYPNYHARNLSARRTNTIGVVVPKIAHFFFSSVIESIYSAAYDSRYEIILTVSQESVERELMHLRSMLSMRVDGLIVSISQQTKDFGIFQQINDMGIPLTFMDRVIPLNGFNKVIADDRGGAFAATQQAITIGYRKLAHIGGFQHINIGKERYLGFESALKQNSIPLDPQWIIHGGFSEEDGYQGFLKLYETRRLPEFIFAVTFPVALGIYRAVEELGMKIPDDIDLICYGHSGLNHFLNPPMSYVEQPTTELGRKAFQLTLENIRQQDQFVPQQIKLPTNLVLCKTCVKKASMPEKIRKK
jgi:LacI family transcriptional regulator